MSTMVPIRRPDTVSAVLATARPRQWIKNVLVLAAPVAAGAAPDGATAGRVGVALVAFVLASVGTYFVNDAADVDADRRHPVKCRRPVAAGALSPRAARWIGLATAAGALLVATAGGLSLAGYVAGYLALTAAYSMGLKHVAVLDILAVAGGFVLRVTGGAAAARVPMSSWFLLTTLFGALFVVTAKRLGEQGRAGAGRRVLAGYSAPWLQQVMTMTLTGTVVAYAAWAFTFIGDDVALPLLGLSLVPFLAGLLRYSLLVSRGAGEAPENVLTGDRFLLVAGLSWASAAGAAIYLG